MSNPAYTPGLWTAEWDSTPLEFRAARLEIIGPRHSICYAVDGATEEEREANARLIAAAPEMLALLQDAEKHCGIVELSDLRAILAKAEGRQ